MFLLITHVLMRAMCRCRNNFAHAPARKWSHHNPLQCVRRSPENPAFVGKRCAHCLLRLHLRSYSSCTAGTVYEFGTPEYDAFIPASTRKAGSRAVIIIDVHKVGTVRSSKFPPDKYPLKDLLFTIPVLRLRRPIVQIRDPPYDARTVVRPDGRI
jgi:hypothetical protein